MLLREYVALKEEVRDVETVRKYAEEVQRIIAPKQITQMREVEV